MTLLEHWTAAKTAAQSNVKLAHFLLAQAVLETGWNGLSGNTKLGAGFNFWGRKEVNTTKKGIVVETKEQKKDGTVYTIVAKFRDYREYGATTLVGAYTQQLVCMRNSSFAEYRNVANGDMSDEAVAAYCKRYATDIKYKEKLLAVMKQVAEKVK